MWTVYVLQCRDRSLYTGIARDAVRRLADHLAGRGSKYVRSRLPARIVHQETFRTHSQALRREAEIKRWPRARKLRLVSRVT